MPVQSPLAISNIIFSQCERPDEPMTLGATPKLSFYRNVLQPNAVPVLLRIRRRRVFLGSLSCVAIIVALTYVFSRGVTLGHVKISSSKSHQAALVQDYNSYLATLVAIVTKPLEVVIAMVVPVATWCFATESIMGTKHSWRTRSLLWMTSAVLLWLLSNAFYGINVQLIDETQVLSAVGLADPTIPAVESQTNSAVNSLLRSATQSQVYRVARSNCTLSSPKRLSGTIEYGFPSRDWMKTVVVDTKSFVNSSRVRLSSVPSDWSSTLPMPVTSAGEVIMLAYPLMHELLRHPLDQPFNGTVASDNILESLTKTHAALESFVNTTSSKSLEWIDVSSAEVDFTRREASSLGNLVFDSVTIELPFQAEYMQRQLTLSENKTTTNSTYEHHAVSDNGEIDYFFDINVKEECGEAGCVVSPRGEGQTMAIVDMGIQVRALAICVDEESSEEELKKTIEVAVSQDEVTQMCTRHSSTSFAVVSLAQRVEGEQMDKANGVIRLKNARKFYSITIARVSWSHMDISSMLGEACSTKAECIGLSIPLSSTSDLVVGHNAIAMEDLRVLRSGGEHWPYLVATSSQEVDSSDNLKGDLIFPSNFKFESESLDLQDQECESERGRLLQSIKVNHWFSTHSLDSAYLSAVFWLFQNGVVIESESSSVSSSTDPTPEISARLVVRVPPKSALYTYAGCSILVLLSVCVLLFSKQTEAQIEKHFRPVHLAQMLVDTSSELCPSTRLVQSDLLNVGGDLLSSSESLTEFEIVSLTLRHRTITTTVIQVPKGPSVSVSLNY